MKKTIWPALNLTLIAAFALAACTPAVTPTAAPTAAPQATQPPAATEAPSGEVKTITIWHQWDGTYLEAIQAALDEYSTMHPDVKIDLSKPDDVSNALNVAIPAGEGPDIIGWANDQIGTQAINGNIVALNDYGVDQAFLESVYEPAGIAGVVWQDKVWALPETQEGIALVYNKDVVTDEYLPTDPNNFDDLLAKATAFHEANPDKYLVCNQGFGGSDAYHVAPVYFGFGVPSYVDDEGQAYLDTPEALAAGEWLVKFSKVSPTEQSYDLCKAGLSEGTIGMWWTGPWAIAGLEADGVNYGIVPMGKPFVGIKTLMLTKNAVDRGNAEIALDIMKYFTSPEVQTKLALTNKTIPAQTAALADPDVAALATLAGFGEALNVGVPMANTPFASAQWGPVGDATVAIWTGAQTPAEALAAAQTAITDAIAQMQ
ncbi:MAG: extracellular solute-binding protein [Anaerolineales bacterium]|nr:extracellular solute-binding protein [Anaerolineales bacterium]